MGSMTTADIRKINAAHDFWASFEYDNWDLISFDDQTLARYGWNENGQYTKYVTIRASEARFLLGAPVDVIDQFIINENHIGD